MPIYDYRCEVCNKQMEVQHSISEDPIIECNCSFGYVLNQIQYCGFPKMKKLIGITSFQLKGKWAKEGY